MRSKEKLSNSGANARLRSNNQKQAKSLLKQLKFIRMDSSAEALASEKRKKIAKGALKHRQAKQSIDIDSTIHDYRISEIRRKEEQSNSSVHPLVSATFMDRQIDRQEKNRKTDAELNVLTESIMSKM